MSQPVTIYALCDPDTGAVRYIGQTTAEPSGRFTHHLSASTEGGALKRRWLDVLVAQGLQPTMRVLATTTSDHADEIERQYITRYTADGAALTNSPPTPPAPSGGHTSVQTGKTRTISVVLSEEQDAQIRAIAQDEDRPLSTLVRQWIVEKLREIQQGREQ